MIRLSDVRLNVYELCFLSQSMLSEVESRCRLSTNQTLVRGQAAYTCIKSVYPISVSVDLSVVTSIYSRVGQLRSRYEGRACRSTILLINRSCACHLTSIDHVEWHILEGD